MADHWIAFTRDVSPTLAACELTHLPRAPIRVDVARAQHRGYERLLVSLGCELRRVTPAPEHPDAVFIEDTAVVLDDVAVITRPGAKARRAEVSAVASALAPERPLIRLKAPATLDGGDVLVMGHTIFVGRSGRTNEDGIAQFRAAVAPHGYAVHGAAVSGCLHLKSAVTAVSDDTVLVNPAWVDAALFREFHVLRVDDEEPMAANVLRVGTAVVASAAYARTRRRLEAHGAVVHTVDVSELAKAEGAVTCCSLILRG
jgi:dimethylargininase